MYGERSLSNNEYRLTLLYSVFLKKDSVLNILRAYTFVSALYYVHRSRRATLGRRVVTQTSFSHPAKGSTQKAVGECVWSRSDNKHRVRVKTPSNNTVFHNFIRAATNNRYRFHWPLVLLRVIIL